MLHFVGKADTAFYSFSRWEKAERGFRAFERCRVGKGGRETSIDAPRRVRRAHAQQLNLPTDFAWARR